MPLLARRISYFLLFLGIALGGVAWYTNFTQTHLVGLQLVPYAAVFFIFLGSSLLFCFHTQQPFRPLLAYSVLLILLGAVKWIAFRVIPFLPEAHPFMSPGFTFGGHHSFLDCVVSLSLALVFLGYVSWTIPKIKTDFFEKPGAPIQSILILAGLLWTSLGSTEMTLWLARAWYEGTGKPFLYDQIVDKQVIVMYSLISITFFLVQHILLQISQKILVKRSSRLVLILGIPLLWALIHLLLLKFIPFSLAIALVWIAQFVFQWTLSLRQISLNTFIYVVFFAAILAGMFSMYSADLYQRKQNKTQHYLIAQGLSKGQPELVTQLEKWQTLWATDSVVQRAVEKDFLTAERLTTHILRNYLTERDSLATLQVYDKIPFALPDSVKQVVFHQSAYWVAVSGPWWLKYTPGPFTPTLDHILQKAKLATSYQPFDSFFIALWDSNQRKMIETKGVFPFLDRTFVELVRAQPTHAFQYKGYNVQLVSLDSGIQWIIATTPWNSWDRLASFGGLFMLSIFLILVIFLLLWLIMRSHFIRYIGFSSRIQLFVQIAFLIPLFLLTFILYQLFDRGLAETQADSQIQVSQNVALGIQKSFQSWSEGKISTGKLSEDFRGISANREQPMALFDVQGKVVLSDRIQNTSIPKIWQEKPIIQDEEIGFSTRRNTAVIFPLFTRLNQPLGWLKLDFLEAPLQLEMRKRNLLRSILIMFVSLFGLLFTTAYWMSTFLTEPLHVLSQRLLGLSLERPNDRLPEDLPDEMGTLTRAYNQMLAKLEDSKRALAQSEKQSAWQEVAKQVAHEIKNPLTPMKLQVQQMARRIPNGTLDPDQQKIKNSLTDMIEKIDHLSDIAYSFSQFAELEIPTIVRFNLTAFLQIYQPKSLSIFETNAEQPGDQQDIWVRQDPGFVEKTLQQIELYLQEKNAQPTPCTISVHPTEYFAQIQVKKSGFDLTEKEKEKLFFPKITEHTAQFGLAMAKKGIESTGGNLWFDQLPGQTNVFYLEIPLA